VNAFSPNQTLNTSPVQMWFEFDKHIQLNDSATSKFILRV